MDLHADTSPVCSPTARRFSGVFTVILLSCVLAGCATQSNRVAYHSARPTPLRHTYLPPGPPGDPWGPYITAASQRFSVPEMWIRAVMHQESSDLEYQNGELTTSSVGATGLMQVMPDTYDMLRLRYGLGPDPYEPHDNIFAGTAYIREMYDVYGFPAFLAAYNAGPHAVEACLATGMPLPMETVNYLSSVAPKLRAYATLSGPLAPYADSPLDMPADDLNRRSLMGQAMPAVQYASIVQTLPCSPSAEDRSADILNRNMLTTGRPKNSYSYSTVAANPSMDTLVRKSVAAAPPPQPAYRPAPAPNPPVYADDSQTLGTVPVSSRPSQPVYRPAPATNPPAYPDGSHVLGVIPVSAQVPQPVYRNPQPAVVPVAAAGSDSDKIGELLINQDYGAAGR
jgi:hypothetical protein